MHINLFRPSVPSLDSYLPYLRRIDANQMYSNFGPMHNQFKNALADHFQVEHTQIELFSSGTMALVATLQALKKSIKPGTPYCLLPSWTFVASAQAAVAAGFTPIFVDVDLKSMQLTAEIIQTVPSEILSKISVVMIVSPFGKPLDLSGLDALSEQYDFEVVCDCAAGFESIKPNQFHSIISLHATKTFGIGEGGFLISPNPQLIEDARSYSNFGFLQNRRSSFFGVNGKLSEFHCAVGLAALKVWPVTKAAYYQKAGQFLAVAHKQPVQFQGGWGESWISSTCVIQFESEQQKQKALKTWNLCSVQTRDWWNQGCHLEPAFTQFEVCQPLDNTLNLAKTTLGIPFYQDIAFEEIKFIFDNLKIQ